MSARDGRLPNRLIREKSPYLLQHAYNQVDWYPWGEEAFSKARREGKPIFLSIGYSSCHWCHVQRRESFENAAIAAMLNKNFVPVKVDREERPDIDEMYMKAVTSITGQGGWPLSVFLTPDLKPFYGGTYFPPTPSHGLPSFQQVLDFISDLWKNKRDEIERNSEETANLVRQSYELKATGDLSKVLLDNGYAVLMSSLDAERGGFGGAPKFPLPSYLEFLLRYYVKTKREPALKAVTKTLDAMASGGIRDHVGGGFHRYSTDGRWLVPHFEKMLYDNAQLARVYLEAYQLTRDDGHAEAGREALEWMLAEMTGPEGGFFSAQDADTPDGEGYYYTWTPEEIQGALGGGAEDFCRTYGVRAEGNFEGGRTILHLEQASNHDRTWSDPQALGAMKAAKKQLLEVRRRRKIPSTDDKVLASWNGLAVSAFACAYQVLGDERYLRAATKCAGFVLKKMRVGGQLYRRYRDGDVAVEGTLEDYAFLALGLVDLYEAGLDVRWLQEAEALARAMVERFWDGEAGGFFMSLARDAFARVKEAHDGPTPSGNSAAAMLLLRLSEIIGDPTLRDTAEKTMRLFSEEVEAAPSSLTYMLCAIDFWLGSREIVIVLGRDGRAGAQRMLTEVQSRFIPNKVLVLKDERARPSPLTEGKVSIDAKATVYVCKDFACKSPATDLETLKKQLDE